MDDVINWRRVDGRVTTSGQPTEAQLVAIKEMGVCDVINLGPHSNKGALDNEAATLAELGMRYIYIPVDFGAPTEADFEAFCRAMTELTDVPVHIHCIYNARVSAFLYRYALEGRGGSVEAAFERMDGIWRPGGIWADFIGKPEDNALPNRYAGYDY